MYKMKTLHLSIIVGIVVITCTSFFLIYHSVYDQQQQMMSNFDPLSQVTTVIIPKGAEDQSSGKNYDPQYIRVIIGVNNTVRWINDGHTMNSVVADNSSDPDFYNMTNRFSAVMENAKMPNFLKPGESFEYTFTKPGYFGYHGVPHPWQRGWVLVLTSDQSDKQIPEHVDLGASGLFDTYAVGQKIDFTIELSGYGITCTIPDIVIQKDDGNIIWHANHPITLCDPQRGGFRIHYKLSDGFGVPIMNETGSYVMVISYDNHTMRLPFVVVPTINDIKDLSESLPQYVTKENQTGVSVSQAIPSCVSNISNPYAYAGAMGLPLCPFAWYSASSKILNATGFYGIYNYTDYPYVKNYVLEPGHNGTLTYSISVSSINTDARIPEYPDGVNIVNDVEFMHDANMHNHPGIDVTVDPLAEIIREHTSSLVNITMSTSQNASSGTYWMHLPPGVCLGGQIIVLTITDCSK